MMQSVVGDAKIKEESGSLCLQGVEQGIFQGMLRVIVKDVGRESGYSQWCTQGYSQWCSKGYSQGYSQRCSQGYSQSGV